MKFPLFVCVFFPLFLFFTATLGRISASFGTVATSGGAFGSRKLKSKPDEQREGIEEPVQNKILYICTHVYNISYIYIYSMYVYIYILYACMHARFYPVNMNTHSDINPWWSQSVLITHHDRPHLSTNLWHPLLQSHCFSAPGWSLAKSNFVKA